MPFDGIEVKPEIAIVDKIIDILKDKNNWCQYDYTIENAVCLYGALRIADGQSPRPAFGYYSLKKRESINVEKKLVGFILGEYMRKFGENLIFTNVDSITAHTSICNFNNNTSHEKLLNLLDKTRKAFT